MKQFKISQDQLVNQRAIELMGEREQIRLQKIKEKKKIDDHQNREREIEI